MVSDWERTESCWRAITDGKGKLLAYTGTVWVLGALIVALILLIAFFK